MLVAAHLPESRFDLQKCRREPAVELVAVLPVINLVRPARDQGIDGLDDVRCLEAATELSCHAQLLECQSLLEPFQKTLGRRLVDKLQLSMNLHQLLLRFLEVRLFLGDLQPLAYPGLTRLRQIGDDVLPLVPLTPLHRGVAPENPSPCISQSHLVAASAAASRFLLKNV